MTKNLFSKGGAALLLGLLAAPALAANATTADIDVVIDSLTSFPDSAPNTITYGETKTYAVIITNKGPNQAYDVEIPVGGITIPAPLKAVAIESGPNTCVPIGQKTAENPLGLPCKFFTPILFGEAEAREVDIDVTFPMPEVLPTTCDAGTALGTTRVSVEVKGSDDPDLANNAAAFDNVTGNFADLAITAEAPASAALHSKIDVPVTVTNNGPCDAINVYALDYTGYTSLTMTEGDPTGDCTAYDFDSDPTGYGLCAFGTLHKGDARTFTRHFDVGGLPSGVMQSAEPVTMDVFSGARPYLATGNGPVSRTKRTYDPNEANNSVRTSTMTSQSVSSCSTGGMGEALSLLALGLPFLRRRRKS